MTLDIEGTQLSDFGSYTCKVSTVDDTKSVSIELELRECPRRIPNINCSSSVSINSSIPLNVVCSDQLPGSPFYYHQSRYDVVHLLGSSSRHPSRITRNASLLSEMLRFTRESIPNAVEDAGLQIITQCCRNRTILHCGSTDEDLCSDNCTTAILYSPSDLVLTQSPSGPWREGVRDASILCRSNGFPSPTVSWQRVDAEGSSPVFIANGTGSSTLFFPNVQRHLAGVYRCGAYNDIGQVQTTAHIAVQYPPNIDRQIPVLHANEGTVASLRCIVDANSSTASMIMWSTSNQSRIVTYGAFVIEETMPSSTKHGHVKSILSFTVHRELFGNYTCTAKNALGSDSVTIQLTGHRYPDPPQDLHVVSYSESSLTLSWTPGQDGGLPMTFTVSYCLNVSEVEKACKTKQAIVTPDLTVSELRSFTLYSITVLAVNDVGNSRTRAEIIASTAPETIDAFGIEARYQVGSGELDISSAEKRPLSHGLCIYAQFHVGGFRHRNETCLRPGQTGYIQNGAKENQLWLVVCGRGVCSVPSPVAYTAGDASDIWRLMVIVIPVLCCFIGFILLLMLIMCIRCLRRRRLMTYDVKTIEPSTSTRTLPTPPAQPLLVGTLAPDQVDGSIEATHAYEVMGNTRVEQRPAGSYMVPSGDTRSSTSNHPKSPTSDPAALPETDQGYTPMDTTHFQGIYMTRLYYTPKPKCGGITSGDRDAEIPAGSYLVPSGDTLSSTSNHPQSPTSDHVPLPVTDQGYTPMDTTHFQGLYMTHLRHTPKPKCGGITSGDRDADCGTCPDETNIQPDDNDDGDDEESLYDTYTVDDEVDDIHHEYLEPMGQASKFRETAL